MVPVLYVILVVFQSVFWVGCGDVGILTVHYGLGEAEQTRRSPALPSPPSAAPELARRGDRQSTSTYVWLVQHFSTVDR